MLTRHKGPNCPNGCQAGSLVEDTRQLLDTVYRNRRCKACKMTWSTWEVDANTVTKLRETERKLKRVTEMLNGP